MPIATEHLILRMPSRRDADALLASRVSYPAQDQWRMAETKIEAVRKIDAACQAFTQCRGISLIIARRIDLALIGWLELRQLPGQSGTITFSIWIRESDRLRGFALEALRASIRPVADFLDAKILRADAPRDNEGAIALITRLRLRPVGHDPGSSSRCSREPVLSFCRDLYGIV